MRRLIGQTPWHRGDATRVKHGVENGAMRSRPAASAARPSRWSVPDGCCTTDRLNSEDDAAGKAHRALEIGWTGSDFMLVDACGNGMCIATAQFGGEPIRSRHPRISGAIRGGGKKCWPPVTTSKSNAGAGKSNADVNFGICPQNRQPEIIGNGGRLRARPTERAQQSSAYPPPSASRCNGSFRVFFSAVEKILK